MSFIIFGIEIYIEPWFLSLLASGACAGGLLALAWAGIYGFEPRIKHGGKNNGR
jgi:hypothetical protein